MERLFWDMDDIVIIASSRVTQADLSKAKMGSRFGRMDLLSQLSMLSVESLGLDFETTDRSRIALCMAADAGSLSTDIEYWKGRKEVGGPSPTLFTYTLPSSAIGEIAIRYRLTGPNLCFVGTEVMLVREGRDLIERKEADGCICIACTVISNGAAELLRLAPKAEAHAVFLARRLAGIALEENPRDIRSADTLASEAESARNSTH